MEIVSQIAMLIFTILYSYYLIDCKRVAFIYGIIASIITAINFIFGGIYIQGILFIIYAISYGLTYFKWSDNVKEDLPQKMNLKQFLFSLIIIALFTTILIKIMPKGPYVICDAITSALSAIGVYWLNKKIIEHAHFMCIANIGSICICLMTGDYIAILTFIVYFIFNVWRFFSWNKIIKGEIKDE